MGRIRKYYALAVEDDEASIHIFGDIVSWEWLESDVSSYTLAKEIEGLDVGIINVYINSYGGEVAEGLAIYNQLRRHKAKVKTYCEGFACSAASVVFMAGDERVMSQASLLMIHNAWTYAAGDQNELRKVANDIETITQASINAYMSHVAISEEELKAMMDAETWIDAASALEMGFATAVDDAELSGNTAQRVRQTLMSRVLREQSAPAGELVYGVRLEGLDTIKAQVGELRAELDGLGAQMAALGGAIVLEAQDRKPEPEPDPAPEPEPAPKGNKLGQLLAAAIAAEEE